MNIRLNSILAMAIVCSYGYDAGSITKDIQDKFGKQQAPANKQVNIQKDNQQTQQTKSNVKVLVKGFTITGNKSIATKLIINNISQFIEQNLTFDELQNITRDIANYYSLNGYSARAFLPPQEIKDGIVEIMIIEGKLSNIVVDSTNSTRLHPDIAKKIVQNAHNEGEVLDTNKLESGLLILSDMSGIRQSSSLSAGASVGDSKLNVRLEDTSLISGNTSYSNSGSRSTGTNQIGVNININSPSQIGDEINIQALKTLGINYGKIGYSIPLGYSGLKWGASLSNMDYNVVNGTDADGNSKSISMYFTYPFVRSASANLSSNLSFEKKSYLNRSYNVETSNKSANTITLMLNGNLFDEYGTTLSSITFTQGKIDLSANDTDYQADKIGANTQGSYNKSIFNLSRIQPLSQDISLQVSSSYQQASKNLDSSERLSLGGISGVRAYPNNEATGDEGLVSNIELIYTISEGYIISLFYDYGHIRQHDELYNNWQGSSTANNSYELKGYGLGCGYSQDMLNAKAMVAFKDGDNPNAQADGTDNDGTDKNPRFWVNLMYMF